MFRHSLPPENLKAFLQKSDDPDDERHKKTGEQPEKQRKNQEKAQDTAGQDTHFEQRTCFGLFVIDIFIHLIPFQK